VTQILQAALGEQTFGFIEKELANHHCFENTFQVMQVCIKSRAINQDIIKENDDEISQERFEEVVHGRLKYGSELQSSNGVTRYS